MVWLTAAVILCGCSNRAPSGYGVLHQIKPGEQPSNGAITESQITDTNELFRLVLAATRAEPPIDHSDEKRSNEVRHASFTKALAHTAPADAKYLLTIQCGDSSSPGSPMFFDPSDRNIHVSMYHVKDKDEASVPEKIDQAMVDLLDNYYNAWKQLVLYGHAYTQDYSDMEKIDPALNKRVVNFTNDATEIPLSDGSVVDITNNPIGSTFEQVDLDLATAGEKFAEARFALTEGRVIEGSTTWMKPLTKEIDIWMGFPDGIPGGKGIWAASVPFAGDAKNVCLIGEFTHLFIYENALKESKPSPMIEAGLVAWYLVDRKTQQIIAKSPLVTKVDTDFPD
jgi:hypothetical protein